MIELLRTGTPSGRVYSAVRCLSCMRTSHPEPFLPPWEGGVMEQQAVAVAACFINEHACDPGEAYLQQLLEHFGAARHGGLMS